MTHGYMLSGTGSNIYVQNLCRALVRGGHDVHLLCQEEHPLDYEFVDEHVIDAIVAVLVGRLTARRQHSQRARRAVIYGPDQSVLRTFELPMRDD